MEIEVIELWNFRPSVLCKHLPMFYPVVPRRARLVEYDLILPRSMGKTACGFTNGKIVSYFKYAIQPMVVPTIKWMKKNAQEKRRYRDAIANGKVYRVTSSTFDRTHSVEKIPYYQKNGLQSW